MVPLIIPKIEVLTQFQPSVLRTEDWDVNGTVKDFQTSQIRNGHKHNGYTIKARILPEESIRGQSWRKYDFVIVNQAELELLSKRLDHIAVVCLIEEDMLYYAEYCPAATGCRVSAFDLKAQKSLWESALYGIGPTGHSEYVNKVYMKMDADRITVFGEESHGRYREVVDRKTGKTMESKVSRISEMHRKFDAWGFGLTVGAIAVVVIGVGEGFEYFLRRRERKRAV